MLKKILLIGLSACLLVGAWGRIEAQNKGVSRAWGKAIGRAHTDRDFLIYDAVCTDNKLFIVGKAESGTDFELKQGKNTYFHAKDENTDAFLACMSLEGELLWSTYLPALENGYYNAFATTIMRATDSSILVVVNIYAIQNNVEDTKALIPACIGTIGRFEFNLKGKLLYSRQFHFDETFAASYRPPRLFKGLYQDDTERFYLQGSSIGSNIDYSSSYTLACSILFHRKQDLITIRSTSFSQTNSYHASFFVSSRLTENSTWGFYNGISLLYDAEKPIWKCSREPGGIQSTDSFFVEDIYCRGVDLMGIPPIRERWTSSTKSTWEYYADPIDTRTYRNQSETTVPGTSRYQSIFPGTVQNIHAYNGKFIVQGIHCRNYDNGFFKKDGAPYAYSHDTVHLIPKIRDFYQIRNNNYRTVPYLILYDSATLFGTDISEEDSRVYDYQTPLWGSYLNADWMYEDFFHVTNRNQSKDVYQPYEPVLCSSGDLFFLIGNAKSIGNDLIDNPVMSEEIFHHQGVVLAFSSSLDGDCPPATTAFQDVRFLCPDDSVELKLSPDYEGFKFRFDPAYLADTSIVLNADSSRAWAKKEGTFAATLDGSSFGCPDVKVDTVKISLSPYPEPVSGMPHDIIAACAAEGVTLNPVPVPDSSFSYRWFDGDSVAPKTVHFNNEILFYASVEVSGYCTSFLDSTRIRFLPPYVDLGNDTLICASASALTDTSVLLELDASQNYFPDADWIFRWKINGSNVSGNNPSLPLRYAELQEAGISLKRAIVTVAVSLSDTVTEGCTAYDTLVLSLALLPAPTPNRFLPQNEILCAHKDLELILPDTAQNYRCFWLDPSSVVLPYGYDTNRFTIAGVRGTDGFGANTDTRSPRFFQLRLDHKLCGVSFFDTLLVYDQVKPAFELAFHDTVICLNEPIELDSLNPFVYRPFYTFEWNDGTQGSGYTFTDSGLYILKFFVNEDFAVCGYDAAVDTVRVLWSDPALTLISLSDTSFCEKLSVTLDATVPYPSTRYSWQEGNLDDLFSPLDDSSLFTPPLLEVDKEVSLALFVVDTMGCVNTRQIAVTEEDCRPGLSIPNVFTPNGDGVNDVLKFKKIDNCFDVDILIVDRKGSHVLHQKVKDPEEFSWNGCMDNGSRKLPDGAYFYFISYKNAYGKKKYQSGSITILGSRE